MRQDYAKIHQDIVHPTPWTERHHTVDGVKREPTNNEKDHDSR